VPAGVERLPRFGSSWRGINREEARRMVR